MRPGFATAAGTRHYVERHPEFAAAGNYRPGPADAGTPSLLLSSIGMGTYLGDTTAEVDDSYCRSVTAALRGGMNMLDTAINYRHQRSERCIGRSLGALIDSRELCREEIVVCTKAGYLSFNSDLPADAKEYFLHEYIRPGIVDSRDVVAGAHCIAPRFLKHQIERSRGNLGLNCIDVFYVHNPETQLVELPVERFQARLRAAFALLEEQVQQGSIHYYGIATWNALRVAPDEPGYMSLENCVELARSVSRAHHFRFVQTPFNLAMTEASAAKHQMVRGEWMSALNAAEALQLTVVGSSTLMQGRLANSLPERLRQAIGMEDDAENALQFARSAPGITTALVGMARPEHVSRNLQLAGVPPMHPENWLALFDRK